MKISGLAVPVVRDLSDFADQPIDRDLRFSCCKNTCCVAGGYALPCSNCLYDVEHHSTFIKTANKYWAKSDPIHEARSVLNHARSVCVEQRIIDQLTAAVKEVIE